MKRKFQILLSLTFICLLAGPFSTIEAQGDLMIMPKRLVFDGSQRSQEVNLANTGKDTAVYAISFINYKMTESGSFEQIETPEEGQRFATDFLRYFPRRVSLAPNEAQTIRVQLTRTGNLEEGEKEKSEGISIQIKTVFGISIPVIIRQGESTTNVTLSDINLDLKEEKPILSVGINRNGNMSVYGDLTVNYIPTSGKPQQIGFVKGISVYTPNSKRYFTMELNAEDIDFTKGILQITYTAESRDMMSSFELKLENL